MGSDKEVADSGHGRGKKKKSAAVVIAVVAVAVVIILLAVIIFLLTRKDPEPEIQGKATIVTEENVQDIIQSANDNTDANYTATMTNEWSFKDGKAAAENFYVANTEANTRTVYFDLQLAGTGETIYSSPYIPVGGEMDTMTLDKDLDAGDYDVIMTYHLVDDEHKELTTVSVTVVIHIQN